MSYQLKWEPSGVTKKFSGVVGDEEFMAATEAVQAHANFDDIWYVINDLMEITSFEVSAHVLECYFASVSGAYRTNRKIKLAFVTKNSDIERQINEFVRISPIPYRSRVFNTVHDARNWIKTEKFHGLEVSP